MRACPLRQENITPGILTEMRPSPSWGHMFARPPPSIKASDTYRLACAVETGEDTPACRAQEPIHPPRGARGARGGVGPESTGAPSGNKGSLHDLLPKIFAVLLDTRFLSVEFP